MELVKYTPDTQGEKDRFPWHSRKKNYNNPRNKENVFSLFEVKYDGMTNCFPQVQFCLVQNSLLQ